MSMSNTQGAHPLIRDIWSDLPMEMCKYLQTIVRLVMKHIGIMANNE